MSPRAASPRVAVLAAVVAAHAGAVLVLLGETRTRLVRGEAETSPLLIVLLEPRGRQTAVTPTRPALHPPAYRSRRPARPEAETAVSAPPTSRSTAINWTAESAAAAARLVEAHERHARQARALFRSPSPMFARAPRRAPGIPWDYASTHRVEPLGGLTTVIHLNDQCAVVLFLIVPFAGGCALEPPPVRGDLFEHMHDRDPAPER